MKALITTALRSMVDKVGGINIAFGQLLLEWHMTRLITDTNQPHGGIEV